MLLLSLLTGVAACSSGKAAPTTTTAAPRRSTTTTLDDGVPLGAVVRSIQSLRPGRCFVPVKDPDAEDRAVWAVDCRDPHTYEVYARTTYAGPGAGSSGYPGATTVQNWSEQACYDRFEKFVGIPWTRSDLAIQTWWPSLSSWGRPDRTVLCAVALDDDSPMVGTKRNSRA